MSADDTFSAARQAIREAGDDAWTAVPDLSEPSGHLGRAARRDGRAARPGQRPSLDEALRGMLRDCPAPAHLQQFVRDLEDLETQDLKATDP
jgi:hypothetical protein